MIRTVIRRGSCPPLLLSYVDAQGERSQRVVSPIALIGTHAGTVQSGEAYLQARCSIAKALRTFRFDRIVAIADPSSGEIIDLQGWVSELELGSSGPFAWSDEPAIDEGLATADAARRRIGWPHIIALMLLFYAIGRLRLIRIFLNFFHFKHGLWL